jgi:hypothetical protein
MSWSSFGDFMQISLKSVVRRLIFGSEDALQAIAWTLRDTVAAITDS